MRILTIASGPEYQRMAAKLEGDLSAFGFRIDVLPSDGTHWASQKLSLLTAAREPTLWLDADVVCLRRLPLEQLDGITTMAAPLAAYSVTAGWTNTGLVYVPGNVETSSRLLALMRVAPQMNAPYWDELTINRMPLHRLPIQWCDTRPTHSPDSYTWHPYKDRKKRVHY